MTRAGYTVEVAEPAAVHLAAFADPAERAEIVAALRRLATRPTPDSPGVIRVRDRRAPQPLFYSHSARFGIYHTIVDQRVIVLAVVRRPDLRITRT